MERTIMSEGITRVVLRPEDASGFRTITFSDGNGAFLTQTGFACRERPVFRLDSAAGAGDVHRTANGEVVLNDEGGMKLLRMSQSAELRFACEEGEILTGLGQHEEGFFDYARREERLYQHNMKISVPFLLSSGGWGLLIENGCAMRFRGEGNGFTFQLDAAGKISYVVIRAENCAEVLKKLSALIGKPTLLPKWAFGYIQSKERYKTSKELIETAAAFRHRGLGLDCIVLDWCSWRDGCWGDKTPDPERFPDVRELADTLHRMNVRLMVSIWPNTAKGQDCDEFLAADAFLPGSRIYDAFSAEARDLYWKQCKRHWMNGGADALWCDSCEPMTDPDWCGSEKRDEDERMRLLTEASAVRMDPERMNDYGAMHVRGIYEHWRKDYPEKRPVILSRSGGLDSGALGTILWSGDVAARWDVLRKQVTEAIRTALSGIFWWTFDIGGFFVDRKEPWFWRGDYPDGVEDPGYRELYIRWFQFGCMLPVFRSHGTDTPREPWQFGGEDSPEYICIKETIDLRYRLLPYLYSTAEQACREGIPMIRAMLAAFPEESALHRLDDQYMLGDALLVKPVTRAMKDGGERTEITLPSGGWYDFFTGDFVSGGQTVFTATPLNRFPVFVRAGSILPTAEGAQCAADVPTPARELTVYEGADGMLLLYDDAGDGYGEGTTIPVRYSDAEQSVVLREVIGRLPETAEMTIRLMRRNGTRTERKIRYDGGRIQVCFRDEIREKEN